MIAPPAGANKGRETHDRRADAETQWLKLAGAALLLVAFAAGTARAEGQIKPGPWEFSVQIAMPNMPKLPPGVGFPRCPGDTMEATFKTRVKQGGATNEISQHLTGPYLGPCEK